jgi:hypothetical protein
MATASIRPRRWRLYKRRYNQAALLAQALSAQRQKPVLVDTLVRTRQTSIQGHLNRKDRLKNVKNAFANNPRHAHQLGDKKRYPNRRCDDDRRHRQRMQPYPEGGGRQNGAGANFGAGAE